MGRWKQERASFYFHFNAYLKFFNRLIFWITYFIISLRVSSYMILTLNVYIQSKTKQYYDNYHKLVRKQDKPNMPRWCQVRAKSQHGSYT